MPEERQTSNPVQSPGIPDAADADEVTQNQQKPPILPDPVAFQVYLRRLAKREIDA